MLPLLPVAGLLFLWDLGSIGLVDETPPLFAASARHMAETGDWLIPSVNGLPRYDKPPLLYWWMALLYGLPGWERFDPLGSWAAALPSALSAGGLLLLLGWLLRRHGRATALAGGLAFGLSPLVLLWSRIGVADLLFTALLSAALISSWLVAPGHSGRRHWRLPWLVLGLAVLAKGPVALLLFALSWGLFCLLQRDAGLRLLCPLRPLRGLSLCLLVCAPWYGLALAREGWAFWNSFFGYHNLQRFTEVVNGHAAPWWFHLAMLVLASLPLTPLLLYQLQRTLRAAPQPGGASLAAFCACWLLAVLLFFSLASTKLPSYWLPATPAAALLVALACQRPSPGLDRALQASSGCALLLAALMVAAPRWLTLIHDPDLPQLPAQLDGLALLPRAALLMALAALLPLLLRRRPPIWRLLALQAPWLLLVPLVLLPLLRFGDGARSAPLRRLAQQVRQQTPPSTPLVMLGAVKPSLHFYSRRVVAFEGTSRQALVNLADRLQREPRLRSGAAAALRLPVVTAAAIERQPHWRAVLRGSGEWQGRYRLWSLDRQALQAVAAQLQRRRGLSPDWDRPRPERF